MYYTEEEEFTVVSSSDQADQLHMKCKPIFYSASHWPFASNIPLKVTLAFFYDIGNIDRMALCSSARFESSE